MVDRVLLTSATDGEFRGARFPALRSCGTGRHQSAISRRGGSPAATRRAGSARPMRSCCRRAVFRPCLRARRWLRVIPTESAITRVLELPVVRGAIESLVGPNPRFDHHFLHVTFPPEFYEARGLPNVSQHTHQDSTIDPRRAFDVQIMYYPHDVTREMGGTRFVPGTHLRVVSEAAVARYQNIRGQQHVVCPAGTLLFLHHGIWHGGGVNRSDRLRYMFKIRINPTVRQQRLWDTSDLPNDHHRAAADLPDQGSARSEQRAHDTDDTGAVVRGRHRAARVSESHPDVALSARRRDVRRRLLAHTHRKRTRREYARMNEHRENEERENEQPSKETPPDERPLTFWQIAGSTAAAAFGVQNRANRERDFNRGKPMHFIIAGIVFTVGVRAGGSDGGAVRAEQRCLFLTNDQSSLDATDDLRSIRRHRYVPRVASPRTGARRDCRRTHRGLGCADAPKPQRGRWRCCEHRRCRARDQRSGRRADVARREDGRARPGVYDRDRHHRARDAEVRRAASVECRRGRHRRIARSAERARQTRRGRSAHAGSARVPRQRRPGRADPQQRPRLDQRLSAVADERSAHRRLSVRLRPAPADQREDLARRRRRLHAEAPHRPDVRAQEPDLCTTGTGSE